MSKYANCPNCGAKYNKKIWKDGYYLLHWLCGRMFRVGMEIKVIETRDCNGEWVKDLVGRGYGG
jgi:hypothetical protein